MYNKLLQRQLSKYVGDPADIPAGLFPLLNAISESYDHADRDRNLLQHSLEITSQELVDLNKKLKKEAEQLKQANTNLATLFENMDDVFYSVDMVSYQLLQISSSCEWVYGYSVQEFMANANLWLEVVLDEDKHIIEANYPVMHAGKPFTQYYRIRHKSGEIRWMMSKIFPTLDDTGKLVRLDGLTSDITERKLAEDTIRRSEAHLRASQRVARVGSWELNVQGKENPNDGILSWSEETFALFGYTPLEVNPSNELFFSHIPESERERVGKAFFDSFTTGNPYSIEHTIVTKTGEVLTVHERGQWVVAPDTEQPIKLTGTVQDITQRRKEEEILRTREAHLTASQRIAKTGSWEVSLAGSNCHEINCSDQCYQLAGYGPGEVEFTLDLFFSHVHPDDRERVQATLMRALNAEGEYNIEHRFITKSGQEIIVHGRAELLTDPSTGQPLKLLGTAQDITQLKRSEERLRQTEANLRNILENTDTSYVLLDPEANIVSFNRLASAMATTELGRELVVGENYVALMSDQRRPAVEQAIRTVIESRQAISYEADYGKVGGAEKWLHVSLHPIIGDAGEAIGLSVAARDITGQKKATELLAQSNERYELVTRATNDVIWDWNLGEKKVYRSKNFEGVLGVETFADTSSDDCWFESIHEADRATVTDSLLDAIHDTTVPSWQGEYRFRKADGTFAHIQDKGLIIRAANGKALRMVGAMRDVTREKQLQLEKDRMTADLLHRNKALEQFAYIVSHNLRAPVANILGLANVLQLPGLDNQSANECISNLHRSTTALDKVITDLNYILQLQDQEVADYQELSFSDIVKDIKSSISHIIDDQNVLIVTDFSAIDVIYSHRTYMRSIFYNLITNSIKYKRTDSPVLISITSKATPAGVTLRFKDNGTGIDLKQNGNKIFGLYKRFHAHIEGKGMGLFMVKNHVESLGGAIGVVSGLNDGTEFTIQLPLQKPKSNLSISKNELIKI